jgi:hypothetical protein
VNIGLQKLLAEEISLIDSCSAAGGHPEPVARDPAGRMTDKMKKKVAKQLSLQRETLSKLAGGDIDYLDPTTLGSRSCNATPAPCGCVM